MKQIVVSFNREVTRETAENQENYKLNGVALDSEDVLVLQPDEKRLIITLNNAFTENLSSQALEVKNVESITGQVLETVIKNFNALDVTLPYVYHVRRDDGNLEITFSEPINPVSSSITVQVDTGLNNVTNMVFKAGSFNTTLSVEFATPLVTGVEYRIIISGARDYAGFYCPVVDLFYIFN